jgi:hypothetical protein
MAICPSTGRIISGGGFSYNGNASDLKPDNILSSYPNVYLTFQMIGVSRNNIGAVPTNESEGWIAGAKNTSGYDALVVWALCGL